MAVPVSSSTSLLDPIALSRIGKMELVARLAMDGYVQGLHRSPHLGFAVDFAQHRQYVPGDDAKRIDWRAYAKADRYYIKQYEVSTDLRAHLVVDASASMAYKGVGDTMSKFRYAQFCAACLAYLILHQQDSVGLVLFDNAVRTFLPPKSTPSQLMQIAQTLDAAKAEKESAIAPLLHDVAERIKHRGMVIIISDFFDKPEAIIEALHHLRHKRHEVLLLQILADDELRFPFRKWSLFENLEKVDDRVRLDPALTRARYLDNVNAYMKAFRQGVTRLNISHVVLNTREPFDKALTTYLAHRTGRK